MTQSSNARKKRKADVVQMKRKGNIELGKNDLRWYENLVLKEQLIKKQAQEAEQLIKKQAQEALLNVAKEAEEMMAELSAREGIDLRVYEIDWATGDCKMPSKTMQPKPAQKPEPAPTLDNSPKE